MPPQDQFLDVIDRDEAERRFRAAIRLAPVGEEQVPLSEALGRVLSRDVMATMDVPSFDRSNFDGYAVRSCDTYGAREEAPRRLRLLDENLRTGVESRVAIDSGTAVRIATGGMVPRGADAVVMVEHADEEGRTLVVRRAATPGFGVAFAGTDVAAGETILRAGDVLTSRETGVLAAIGLPAVWVWRRPRVAILSTGDEIIAPGDAMRPGLVYDSNGQILADAVRELGGEPISLGIVRDDETLLRERLHAAIDCADVVLLSGGTSKGEGDLCYRLVGELTEPGIVAHGVALKPGKPICLAGTRGKPVVILPGFPTSAIFTFHEFVAPVIRLLGGRPTETRETVAATLAVKTNSEIGRTEYLLVGLVPGASGLAAYPMGKGSGSVTTFSQADGFITIPRHTEMLAAGASVDVHLLARNLRIADLVVIGSHCTGLDYLLGELQRRGQRVKFLAAGSSAGLAAAERGECDLAGVHLLDAASGVYNVPFLTPRLELVRGYGRSQGVVFRAGDTRFASEDPAAVVRAACAHPDIVMVNRNQGSGTRILIDRLLAGAQPAGYAVAARSHNAVAAAIAQSRADWGVAIETVARGYQLGFLSYQQEQFDFVVPRERRTRPAVHAFVQLLAEPAVREKLREMGFSLDAPAMLK